jgi:hypothetical protein
MAVDVVIANAAINLSHDVKYIDVDTDHQDEICKINVRLQPRTPYQSVDNRLMG